MKLSLTSYRAALKSAALVFAGFLAVPSFADYQALQTESVSAGAFVGGGTPTPPPAGPVLINHTPLISGSPITQEVIIMGEAGEEIPVTPPPYESRFTSNSQFEGTPSIRTYVRFRFVTLEQAQGLEPAPVPTDLPAIDGPDPIPFAFQITPSAFDAPVLQYRIIAERLKEENGQLVVTSSSATFPAVTSENPDPWVTIGIQANASQVFGPEGGRLVLPDGNPADGESSVDVPAGLFGTPTTISLDEVPLDGSQLLPFGSRNLKAASIVPSGLGTPIAVYSLNVDPPFRGVFQVTLLYPDFEYPRGQDGVIDGTEVPEQNTAVFGWDGHTWRRLGGNASAGKNTLSIKAGMYSFLAIAPAAPLTPEGRRPLEKIITPNGDGQNDEATFTVASLSENYKIEILDTTGHRIRTVQSGQTPAWDGRNDSGEIVESGVYIYQFKVEGKTISGVIAVAK